MNLKKSFILAIVLALIGLISWESYWRSKPEFYKAVLEDDRYLWAEHRAKVEKATKEDVIILGSSRAYFDIQVAQWKNETGKEPLQLASTGSSPLPTFHDIVNNTEFNGTIIVSSKSAHAVPPFASSKPITVNGTLLILITSSIGLSSPNKFF